MNDGWVNMWVGGGFVIPVAILSFLTYASYDIVAQFVVWFTTILLDKQVHTHTHTHTQTHSLTQQNLPPDPKNMPILSAFTVLQAPQRVCLKDFAL